MDKKIKKFIKEEYQLKKKKDSNLHIFAEVKKDYDGADTFTHYNWTIDKKGNIIPYKMLSFSMFSESILGVDPLNPEHDEAREIINNIKKIFNVK